ncbi:GGDEF domain-containing protein [Anatilimnocola floriformis]|uniref:GGDEF domain-containing protein n=1 Tax=Anatilimnocola floriformis TaxID=2948575 RepID=UPI0020C53C21|nr:GGDEF domain-containing protein [Anatilimnocola floriformis]
MTTLILETAIALTAASAGAAAGWCFRKAREGDVNEQPERNVNNRDGLEQEAQNNRQAAKDLLSQVHGLTTKVASQVGEHNLRVQAINEQLTSGDNVEVSAVTEAINRLVEANAWMQQQLDSAHCKLESQARLIESHVNEARTDALTGIANRRAFDEEMQRCLTALRLERDPACVMMIDVDHFKKFNDTHGHKAGDEVLRHVAAALKQAAGSTGIVCRYGGEEFAVVFPKQQATTVVQLAERCRAAIGAQSINYDGQQLQVHASAGLAEFAARDTMETVLERADEALYASKRGGRNNGHVHDGKAFVPFVNNTPPAPSAPEMKTTTSQPGSLIDPATGLSTRDALREDLQRRLAGLQREVQPLSLLVIQIDRMKDWQAKGGDDGESLALRTVSLALRGIHRNMDHAARFDHDAFAVALNGANLPLAVEVAQRLKNSLQSARPKLAGQPTPLTLSIGVCEAVSGDDAAKLILRAQSAQNTAANLGGNQISMHDGNRISLVEEVLC